MQIESTGAVGKWSSRRFGADAGLAFNKLLKGRIFNPKIVAEQEFGVESTASSSFQKKLESQVPIWT